MSQPLDRTCKIVPLGKIDAAAGEFWTDTFSMPKQGDNLSAFEPNRMFLNVDGARFLDASFFSRADIDSDSRSVIVGDFDGDRAPDLLVGSVGGGPLRLFLNRFADQNHRVELVLRGRESNRSAIGARVTVEAGGRKIVRDLFPANGFMGQSPAQLLVGVATAESIDSLEVRWPTGKVQTFRDLPVDCGIEFVEGAAAVSILGARN